MGVHLEMNNFYNEPPFAERLEELVTNNEVPITAKYSFVNTVLTCYVGNEYGQSRGALSSYLNMIKNFTPKEIEIMLSLNDKQRTILSNRIMCFSNCKKRYKEAISLLNKESIPSSLKNKYESIIE